MRRALEGKSANRIGWPIYLLLLDKHKGLWDGSVERAAYICDCWFMLLRRNSIDALAAV